LGPLQFGNGSYQAEIQLPDTEIDASRYAVASWVSDGRRQASLQATGGWLK
jgi:hypothetical protein